MKNAQLEKLIQDLTEGCITPQDLAELESELISNPQSMSRYIAYQDLDNLLQVSTELSAQQSASVVPIELILQRQKRKDLRTAMLSAAALVMLTFVVMRLLFVSPNEPSLTFQTSPGTQFTLSHSKEGQADMTLNKGSRLQLEQGSVELTFESGVKSIVYAPADLTLEENNLLFLNNGSAWFDVPKEAIGFTVKTNALEVIDLGTQFGVHSKAEDYDEVHVFKGSIIAKSRNGHSETLFKGEARRLNARGSFTALDAKESDYITALPTALPHIHWSFDRDFQAAGSHPAAHDIHTSAIDNPKRVLGRVGSAIELDGLTQYLESDWPGFSGNRPRTVAFWLKVPANADFTGHPRGITGWGDNYSPNAKWKIALTSRTKERAPSLVVSWGNYWLNTRESLDPGQWHHVLVSSSGKLDSQNRPQAEIYLNGQRIRSIPRPIGTQVLKTPDTKTLTLSALPLVIGNDLRVRSQQTPMQGVIDELYVFDGYMSQEDVHQWLPSVIAH